MKYLTILGSIIICASLVAMSGCKPDPSGKGGGKKDVPKVDPKNTVQVEFNADSAYRYVAEQVAFGPRVPGTAAHGRTLFYLLKQLQRFTDTAFIQAGDLKISTGAILPVSNVFGRINPENPNRFVLAAHWDTRPQSDEDPFINDKPADGANDGASGVGVLIEIARQLQKLNPTLGIDILFFDQEDGGLRRGAPDTWCVGSQFWGDWAIKNRYTSMGGILLDMVGAKGATFGHEAHSIQFNQSLMLETWRIGQQLGYGAYFVNVAGGLITDDHYYMNTLAGVKMIDIIHYDLNTPNNFPSHWHKQTDNMDAIDKATLKAVGHTVLQLVMNKN